MLWALAFMVGSDEALQALGFLREHRPAALRYGLVAFALLPFIVTIIAPSVRWLRRIRWLFPDPHPGISLAFDGLELRIPGRGVRWLRWDEIGSLARSRSGTDAFAFRSPDGDVIARVPEAFAEPSVRIVVWNSLAEAIVGLQPGRFILDGATPTGSPNALRLRRPGDPPGNGDRWRRRRRLIGGISLLVLLLFAAWALKVLIIG